MGSYYKTQNPKYVDFIYQPNYDLKLAESNLKSQIHATDLQIQDAASNFRSAITFENQIPKANAILDEKKNAANEVTNMWLQDKSASNYKALKNSYKSLVDEYTQGTVAAMEQDFVTVQNTYMKNLDEINKEKDQVKKDNDFRKLNQWYADQMQRGNAADYDPTTYQIRSTTTWFDAQKNLNEVVDKKMLQTSFSTPGYLNNTYIDGGQAKPIPSGWKVDNDLGFATDENGTSYPLGTAKGLSHILGFEYNEYSMTIEGYNEMLAEAMAKNYLGTNLSFQKDIRDEYYYLDDDAKKLKTEEEFIKDRIQNEVNTFTAPYKNTTKYEIKADRLTNTQAQMDYQFQLDRKKKQLEDEDKKKENEKTFYIEDFTLKTYSKDFTDNMLKDYPAYVLGEKKLDSEQLALYDRLFGNLVLNNPEQVLTAFGRNDLVSDNKELMTMDAEKLLSDYNTTVKFLNMSDEERDKAVKNGEIPKYLYTTKKETDTFVSSKYDQWKLSPQGNALYNKTNDLTKTATDWATSSTDAASTQTSFSVKTRNAKGEYLNSLDAEVSAQVDVLSKNFENGKWYSYGVDITSPYGSQRRETDVLDADSDEDKFGKSVWNKMQSTFKTTDENGKERTATLSEMVDAGYIKVNETFHGNNSLISVKITEDGRTKLKYGDKEEIDFAVAVDNVYGNFEKQMAEKSGNSPYVMSVLENSNSTISSLSNNSKLASEKFQSKNLEGQDIEFISNELLVPRTSNFYGAKIKYIKTASGKYKAEILDGGTYVPMFRDRNNNVLEYDSPEALFKQIQASVIQYM